MAFEVFTRVERPDLYDLADQFEGVWPEYNYHGDVMNEYWHCLREEFPELQFVAYDQELELVVGHGHSISCWWDGTVAGLPDGIDEALIQGVERRRAGKSVNTLCAMAPGRSPQ